MPLIVFFKGILNIHELFKAEMPFKNFYSKKVIVYISALRCLRVLLEGTPNIAHLKILKRCEACLQTINFTSIRTTALKNASSPDKMVDVTGWLTLATVAIIFIILCMYIYINFVTGLKGFDCQL